MGLGRERLGRRLALQEGWAMELRGQGRSQTPSEGGQVWERGMKVGGTGLSTIPSTWLRGRLAGAVGRVTEWLSEG